MWIIAAPDDAIGGGFDQCLGERVGISKVRHFRHAIGTGELDVGFAIAVVHQLEQGFKAGRLRAVFGKIHTHVCH